MTEDMWEEYLKMSTEITEKLDNTAEYESWLIIQDYVDFVQQKYEKYKDTVDRLIGMLEYNMRFSKNSTYNNKSILDILKGAV